MADSPSNNAPASESLPPEESVTALTWRNVRLNAVLFVLTVVTVFMTGESYARSDGRPGEGWLFAVPLLGILLAHEFGHYFAARHHGVPASLPYFIPLPFIGLFGTFGAVIAMPARIRSRNALLDIGASGPIAGLIVAIPVLAWGIASSPVQPQGEAYMQEGQSLFYWALKALIHGAIPAGSDVHLHPTAFAGWAGLFLTMLNLIPYGQLDGGHIAYALFGEKQNRTAPWIRRALLPLFLYVLVTNVVPLLSKAFDGASLSLAIGNSISWLVLYALLGVLARLSGRDHPPCEPGELSPWRRAVAWLCLILFVLLFMPRPIENVV